MIGPHLLRRVKEQVEKSIPPKEETIIDVELTTLQKKYYRAIFERNRQFLYKVRIAPPHSTLDGDGHAHSRHVACGVTGV